MADTTSSLPRQIETEKREIHSTSANIENINMSKKLHAPPDVLALYEGVARVLDAKWEDTDRKVGDCKWGVYLFYDYDEEPIYVGQTTEKIRTRIRRHLTNQRTDAVAMSVLDPFEVAEIEIWPFWDKPGDEVLDQAEYTVYCHALSKSQFNVVLNEKEPEERDLIELPPSIRLQILTGSVRGDREHPDLRLARRARTIANLARVISERKVGTGIRRTLWAQAQRLEWLARRRLEEIAEHVSPADTQDDGLGNEDD